MVNVFILCFNCRRRHALMALCWLILIGWTEGFPRERSTHTLHTREEDEEKNHFHPHSLTRVECYFRLPVIIHLSSCGLAPSPSPPPVCVCHRRRCLLSLSFDSVVFSLLCARCFVHDCKKKSYWLTQGRVSKKKVTTMKIINSNSDDKWNNEWEASVQTLNNEILNSLLLLTVDQVYQAQREWRSLRKL